MRKTSSTDLAQWSMAIGSFYNSFIGTKAGDIIYNLSKGISNEMVLLNDDDFLVSKGLGLVNPDKPLSEKVYSQLGIDEKVGNAISQLEAERDNFLGNKMQLAMLDYTIWTLRRVQMRDLPFKLGSTGLADKTTNTTLNKWANFTIYPKVAPKYLKKIELDEDEVYDPNTDIITKEHNHTLEEYTQAFEVQGLPEVLSTGQKYSDELDKAFDMMKAYRYWGNEDSEIRHKLLTAATAHRDAIEKAVNAPAESTLILYGSEKNQGDTVSSGERSLKFNLESMNFEVDYLKSGLPVVAFNEMRELKSKIYKAREFEKELKKLEKGASPEVKQAAKKLNDDIEELNKIFHKLPGEKSTKEERDEYCSNVRNKINEVVEGLKTEGLSNLYGAKKLTTSFEQFSDKLVNLEVSGNKAWNEAKLKDCEELKADINEYGAPLRKLSSEFDETFEGTNHHNSDEYEALAKAFKEYKDYVNGYRIDEKGEKITLDNSPNLIQEHLEKLQEKAEAYRKSKHWYEGWKGDGAVRYKLAGDVIAFAKKTAPQVQNMLDHYESTGIIYTNYDIMKEAINDDNKSIEAHAKDALKENNIKVKPTNVQSLINKLDPNAMIKPEKPVHSQANSKQKTSDFVNNM